MRFNLISYLIFLVSPTVLGQTMDNTVPIRPVNNASVAPFTYCGYRMEPFLSCSDTGKLQGYEKSIIDGIETRLGHIEDVHYVTRCVNGLDEAFSLAKQCECDAITGHLTPTAKRLVGDKIRFSEWYLGTSLAAVVRKGTGKDIFAFLTPFSLGVWVLAGLTPFIFGFVSYIATRPIKFKHFVSSSTEYIYAIFGSGEIRASNDETECMIDSILRNSSTISFLFFFLFITSVYTANLASIIIRDSVVLGVESLDEFIANPKLRVVTNGIYREILKTQYNIDTIQWNVDSSDDFFPVLEQITNKTYDALVTDRGAMLWAIRATGRCDVALLPGSDVSYFGVGIGYSPCTNESYIFDTNFAILQMKDSGELDRISKTQLGYLYYKASGHSTIETFLNPECAYDESVALQDIIGLVIIIFTAPFLSVLYTIWKTVAPRILRKSEMDQVPE